jgi:hypothetical protein
MGIDAQVIAAGIAGFVAPFIQEILLGAKVSGRLAVTANVVVTVLIATLAHWLSGGFADAATSPAFNLVDPRAFVNYWWAIWAPVFVLSKLTHGFLTKYMPGGKGDATGPIQSVAERTQPVVDKLPIIGTGTG